MAKRDAKAARARRRRRERATVELIRRLERAHGLRWRQRRILDEVAVHYGLPGPAPLYFRPSLLDHYAEELAGARRLSRRLAVQEISGILFGDGAGGGPPSFTAPDG